MSTEPRSSWTGPLTVAVTLLFLLSVVGLVIVDAAGGGTVLTSAAEATTAEGSARMTMEMSFEIGADRTTMTADGLVDFSEERARMTMRSAAFSAPLELVSQGNTVYIQATAPPFAEQAAGKPWLAYDASGYAPGFGGDAVGGADPRGLLRLLEERGVAGDVRQGGREQVRGVPTTRYTADVDVQALLGEFDGPQFRETAEALEDAEATITVWIGAEDVVRRSSMAMRFRVEGQSFATTVTMELFDFGVPVDVVVPPADQVHQVEDILGT